MAKKIIDTAEWDRFISENTESLDMSDHYDRGFADGLGVADMFIDPLPLADEPRWIPETERLPEHNKKVLCIGIDGSCSVMLYNHFESGWKTGIFSTNLYCRGLITHWMPLPEPPEVE